MKLQYVMLMYFFIQSWVITQEATQNISKELLQTQKDREIRDKKGESREEKKWKL
jgi:hypothetical protein